MPFPLTPFDSSLSIASPNAPPRTDHQAMPFPHIGAQHFKSTRTSPTTDRSCLSTPFDSSVSNASPNAPPTADHCRRFSQRFTPFFHGFTRFFKVLLNSSMVLLKFSVVLLNFPWFCSIFLGFCSIFPWFSFTSFFHGLPNFQMVLLDFPWFFHGFTRLLHNFTLPFLSPQMHLGGWTRGESIPHRHPIATWYKLSKSSNLHPSHCT